jgi:hypothetical protein
MAGKWSVYAAVPLVALIICAVLATSGCTSMQPISAAEVTRHVKPGDHVRIQTRDHKSHAFVVTRINDHVIAGDDVEIAREDVISRHRRTLDGGIAREIAFADPRITLLLGMFLFAAGVALFY